MGVLEKAMVAKFFPGIEASELGFSVKSEVALYVRSCMVYMIFMHILYLHVVLHGDCTVNKVGYTFAICFT